jgi:aminoglycoside 3-N-acetyltransferase I
MEIRQLGPGELADFRAKLAMFSTAFEDSETYATRQPDDDYLRKLLSSEHFLCIVARYGSTVVGGPTGYVLPKFEQARSEFYIYDLAVDASHRRRGVATAMIQGIRRLAAERGFYVIFVQADCEDEPAIALYTKLGTREDVLHFDIAPFP